MINADVELRLHSKFPETAVSGETIKFYIYATRDVDYNIDYEVQVYQQGNIIERIPGDWSSGFIYDSLSDVVREKYTIPSDVVGTLEFRLHRSGNVYPDDEKILEVLTPTYIAPTISSFTVTPSTGTYALQGRGTIEMTVKVGDSGSGSITKYQFATSYSGHTTQTKETDEYSKTCTFNTPNIAGQYVFQAKVFNEYEKSAIVWTSVDVYEYSSPYFTTFNAYRSDKEGNKDINGAYITWDFAVRYSSVNNTNKVKVTIYLDGQPLHTTDYQSGNNQMVAVKYTSTDPYENTFHTVCAEVYDFYNSSTTSSMVKILGADRILNISEDGTGVAIGKMSSGSKKFECRWNAYFDGTIHGTLSTTSSDERIKKNIKDINMNIVNKLRPVQYQLNNSEDDKNHYGFIAQEVEKIFEDEGVDPTTVGLIGHIFNNGRDEYVLAYTEFIPLLVGKCQSLQQELDDLKSEIKALKESS